MSVALTIPIALALARTCAPQVAPETLLSVVRAESALDPLVIGVNGRPHRVLHPRRESEALAAARDLLRTGADFDVGLAQINVRNLPRIGLSLEQAFDPCRNLAGGAQILTENYLAASRAVADPQRALKRALSLYNTGNTERGFTNGYVARVAEAAARVVPALASTLTPPPPAEPATSMDPVRLAPISPGDEEAKPGLDVFAPTSFQKSRLAAAVLAARSRRAARIHPRFRRTLMNRRTSFKGRTSLEVAATAAVLALAVSSPALAQSSSSAGGNIGAFVQNVIDILNNNVVRGLAVIAVIITGISWMFGAVDLRRAGTVIVGIIVIFSASTIVSLVTGGA